MDHSITSNLEPALLRAYGETHYCVMAGTTGTDPFVLKVGEVSKELAVVHKKFGVDCSAFVTAFNPWGERLSEAENAKRQEQLLHVLRGRSLRWLDGLGQHPSNEWPGESSVLILGLSLAAAKVLAQDLKQNALVWSGADAKPQLVLLR